MQINEEFGNIPLFIGVYSMEGQKTMSVTLGLGVLGLGLGALILLVPDKAFHLAQQELVDALFDGLLGLAQEPSIGG